MNLSTIDRHPDWQQRLVSVANLHLQQSAVWGKTDCIQTVGESILATTGQENPFLQFLDKYTTELGAAKVMRQHDCNDVVEVFEKFLGLSSLGGLSVRRGDVAVAILQDQPHAGYVMNEGVLIRQPQGMLTLPLTQIHKAYQIGRR